MSSKRGRRRRSCESKVAYDTHEGASMAAARLGISVYRCPFGDHYHVGHAPGTYVRTWKHNSRRSNDRRRQIASLRGG